MPKYTTGEIARLCDVTVRTVQYYDARGILTPSELSEGGRRLYSEEDLQRMRTICFLRQIGFSIEDVRRLMNEENSEKVILLLLRERAKALRAERAEIDGKLSLLEEVGRGLHTAGDFSVNSIRGIVTKMKNKNSNHRTHMVLLWATIPMFLLELAVILIAVLAHRYWPIAVFVPIDVVWSVFVSKFYYRNTDYICPECGETFHPKFSEVLWAAHTFNTRKLTCPKCGKRSFCVETAHTEGSEKAEETEE